MSLSVPLAGCGPIRPGTHDLLGDLSGGFSDEGTLASFDGATGWLNSPPISPNDLLGKVVLVDFWTYTCINWLRTLPYVRAWAGKYAGAGLAVVGVHTPEFDFEHDLDNVATQAKALGVDWPIAIDNDYAVWNAFSNNYWPALYLADVDGRIRFHHFGEGEYDTIEQTIQQLLPDAGAEIDQSLVEVDPQGLEVAADWPAVQSAETYTGYQKSAGPAQVESVRVDEAVDYTPLPELENNSWALSGNWTVTDRAANSNLPGARIAFLFHARDLNLVMKPVSAGRSIPFRVYLDGQIALDAAGSDVNSDGGGLLDEARTYQLIRQTGSIEWSRFEIEFADAGAAVYCFTFG